MGADNAGMGHTRFFLSSSSLSLINYKADAQDIEQQEQQPCVKQEQVTGKKADDADEDLPCSSDVVDCDDDEQSKRLDLAKKQMETAQSKPFGLYIGWCQQWESGLKFLKIYIKKVDQSLMIMILVIFSFPKFSRLSHQCLCLIFLCPREHTTFWLQWMR
jgi:hypothetical protein